MPILVDGNNLLHRLPSSERSRGSVRRQVLDATRHETVSVTVVFGTAAKQWSVVTDDRGLARRARDRGAQVRSLADWQRRRKRPSPARPRIESKLSSLEITEWETYFAGGESGDSSD